MSELSVKHLGATVRVPIDEQGRPRCFCGMCSGVMSEVAPNEWRCEYAVAVSAQMRELAATLVDRMEKL